MISTAPAAIEALAEASDLVGRRAELRALAACFSTQRHVLLEGPVGVGKTALARAMAHATGRPWSRVDGDGRYTEARLVGHFDPPGVLSRGYQPDLFIQGPLVAAMRAGGTLFINELNRMPEGVQNVLLPAMDEGRLQIPRLGEVLAEPGFTVIATQNPSEFIATGLLSEALRDRFELVLLGHPPLDDEREIVRRRASCAPELVGPAVEIARRTRTDPRFRRGASVRGAIAIAELAGALGGDVLLAARIALPTRVELADPDGPSLDEILAEGSKKKRGM